MKSRRATAPRSATCRSRSSTPSASACAGSSCRRRRRRWKRKQKSLALDRADEGPPRPRDDVAAVLVLVLLVTVPRVARIFQNLRSLLDSHEIERSEQRATTRSAAVLGGWPGRVPRPERRDAAQPAGDTPALPPGGSSSSP